MAHKWGSFNRQMAKSKMAAKFKFGVLSTKTFSLVHIHNHAKMRVRLAYFQGLAAWLFRDKDNQI